MEPQTAFRDRVLAHLPQLRDRAWQPLAGGRTNRLWRLGDTVVKGYAPSAASPLFPNDPQAETRALEVFGPLGLAPQPVGAGADWVAYRHVEGRPWSDDPALVAGLLHRLHRTEAPGFRALPTGSAAILAQAAESLRGCRGGVGPAPPDPGVPPLRALHTLHGDAVPGNIIVGPKGLTLIDWQCPARGDPAEDLATFLSPAMQWLYRGRVLSEAEVTAFLAAYPDPATRDRYRALAPLYRWRMAAHCLWKAERGDRDYVAALRLELG